MKKKDAERSIFGIIGLGRFGMALAMQLAETGKEMIVVDQDESKIRAVRAYTDNAYVCKDITKEALMEMGFKECSAAVVCIGERIDASVLTTLNVVSLGIPRVVAKAASPEHGAVLEKIGAEVVYPEADMGKRLAKWLTMGNVIEYISLSSEIDISELKVTDKLIGQSIIQADLRKRFGINIIAIEHDDETTADVDPSHIFAQGDKIVVIGKTKNIYDLENYLDE